MASCTSCGRTLTTEDRFCGTCGTSAPSAPTNTAPASTGGLRSTFGSPGSPPVEHSVPTGTRSVPIVSPLPESGPVGRSYPPIVDAVTLYEADDHVHARLRAATPMEAAPPTASSSARVPLPVITIGISFVVLLAASMILGRDITGLFWGAVIMSVPVGLLLLLVVSDIAKNRERTAFVAQVQQGFETSLAPDVAQSYVVGPISSAGGLVTAMSAGVITGTAGQKKGVNVVVAIVLFLACWVFGLIYIIEMNKVSQDPFTIQFVPSHTGSRVSITGSPSAIRALAPAFACLPDTGLDVPTKS